MRGDGAGRGQEGTGFGVYFADRATRTSRQTGWPEWLRGFGAEEGKAGKMRG